MSVLEVRELTVRDAAGTALVQDLTFGVGRGKRVGLIGESGSGKSMTALAVLGLLPEGLTATGSVRLRGRTAGWVARRVGGAKRYPPFAITAGWVERSDTHHSP